jgi:hypothetical protein
MEETGEPGENHRPVASHCEFEYRSGRGAQHLCVSEINCNEWIQVIVYIFFRDMETQLAKHLFLSLCNLENRKHSTGNVTSGSKDKCPDRHTDKK